MGYQIYLTDWLPNIRVTTYSCIRSLTLENNNYNHRNTYYIEYKEDVVNCDENVDSIGISPAIIPILHLLHRSFLNLV